MDDILDIVFNFIVAILTLLVAAAGITVFVAVLCKMIVFIFTFIWGL